MTTYGLTLTGFNPKTAAVIEDELIEDITAIPGFEDIPTDGASAWGNLISILSEREALLWGLLLAIYQSAFRDSATGASLDAAMANIAKSRNLERHSTIDLTLYNRTNTNPVTVPIEYQARQSSTGVIWETLEEVEIPALTTLHSSLDIDAITWQSGTTVRDTFNGTPDLSDVAIGDTYTVTGAANDSNNGTFTITAVSTGSYYVEYLNADRTDGTDDEASDTAATADIVDVETSVTASAQSLSAGAFEATIGTIDQIVTPISGWDAVTNLGAAIVGRSQETDAEFRLRVADELSIANGSTLEAIKAALRQVDGVTYVTGTDNRTGAVDGDGNKANSYRFTVVGGTDQDIIDAIGTYGAGGIDTNGTTSGTWTDPEGREFTIYFDRATEINPYIIVNLTINEALWGNLAASPDAGASALLLKAALKALEFDAGEDLYNFLLIAAATNAEIPGILAMTVYQGTTASPGTSATITVDPDEVINITTDRIIVNTSV